MRVFRGVLFATPLALVLWAVIAILIWRYV